ncbi:AmmeMemoRadiSam system protein B [Carboxylicivirga sp. A043]|uniref:AmmeMemoRadiSam system protein B n=1 Tax=Carboxylicivirga litoralis TaxID=2816963 RepID=UPI0021CB98A8|nr:AmmeMemoRadiSam system protein B [Carboxylicivirga sp. A043]MCU4156218.1 AmmeMemoRadiSam system protein B [Carboxylicivirga sp. A043]
MKRKAAVAGTFYPGEKHLLVTKVNHYLDEQEQVLSSENIRALIVPHAGYVYSGSVAADAFVQIIGQAFDTVFLIGTSHQATYKGAALCDVDIFETPIGDVVVNTQITAELCSNSPLFQYNNYLHRDEHTLEVQLPFLQGVLSDFQIVPLLIGTKDTDEIQQIADQLKPYFRPSNLFVISTDFSHYPPASFAGEEDKSTAEVISINKAEELIKHLENQQESLTPNLLTGLCSWTAVLTLLYLTRDEAVVYHKLSYEHSGMKLQRDTSRVVGYQAFAISDKPNVYNLTQEERKALLNLAHQSIVSHIKGEKVEEEELALDVSGVFVSVYCQDELRGCLGHVDSRLPLGQLIRKLAVDAAFYDSRFKAIEAEELEDVHIEISLLTPLKQVDNLEEIEVGRHGIYIKKGFSSGLFLPQVGARNHWSTEEFLGHCSKSKAQIGWDGWKDANIFTFEAMIIADKDEARG